MSVRKRTWKTAAGEERQAWLCDYTGQSGKRHVKTFARKKDADAFITKAKVEVREGVHTADSDSVTIRDAADLWLTTGTARGLYRHCDPAQRPVCALRGSRHLGLLCHRGHDHFAAPVDRSSGPYGQNRSNHGADSR